jgi:hypothetical protein
VRVLDQTNSIREGTKEKKGGHIAPPFPTFLATFEDRRFFIFLLSFLQVHHCCLKERGAMNQIANLALEGGDPRNPEHPITGAGAVPIETQLLRAAHDSSVSFEEYVYWASITRSEEKLENQRHISAAGPKTLKTVMKNRFTNYKAPATIDSPTDTGSTGEKAGIDEKGTTTTALTNSNRAGITDSEYKNASRAIRTAGWSSVFYLITTDILGPFSTPYVPLSLPIQILN